jgi:hypothetical protein
MIMQDNQRLRDMVSHRVRLDCDNGSRVFGYLARALPAHGPVSALLLHRAHLLAPEQASGKRIDQLTIDPGALVGAEIAEGPRRRVD